MKKTLKNTFITTLVLALFMTSFVGIANAQEFQISEEQEIEEMAKTLEFVFDEATIVDENGNFIGLDFNLIEEQYGYDPQIEELKHLIYSENVIAPMNAELDNCINKKIKNGIAEFLSVGAIATVINYIAKGEYKLAATKLIKMGVKGNAVSVAAQLLYYYGKCQWEVNGWWGK